MKDPVPVCFSQLRLLRTVVVLNLTCFCPVTCVPSWLVFSLTHSFLPPLSPSVVCVSFACLLAEEEARQLREQLAREKAEQAARGQPPPLLSKKARKNQRQAERRAAERVKDSTHTPSTTVAPAAAASTHTESVTLQDHSSTTSNFLSASFHLILAWKRWVDMALRVIGCV